MGTLIGIGNTVPQFPYTDLWYGIRINIKNGGHCVADGKLERVGNLDLHRSLPIQKRIKRFMANLDGSVNYWLGANDSTLKEGGGAARLNALDGNVMLYKPDYYRRIEFDGEYLLVAISEVALPGFTHMKEKVRSPWLATFDRTTNKPVSACFLQFNSDGSLKRDDDGILVMADNAANYRGGTNNSSYDGTYRSMLGMPATSNTKSTIRTRCKSLGDNYHHGGWRFREEMSWLMAIEFGDLDSDAAYNSAKTSDGFAQGGLGNGTLVASGEWSSFNGYNPLIPCGVTAKLGNNTGVVSYTIKNWKDGADKVLTVASYRGWEQPQRNLWEHNDDVLVHNDKPSDGGAKLLYLCSDPSKFTTPSDKATAVPDGYVEVGALPSSSGYISEMGVGNGYTFPSSVTNGASNKMYCDYYWAASVTDDNGADGWYQLLSAAYAGNSEHAGVRCADAKTRGANTNAYYGFPLCLDFPSSEGI
jgi:hypothetical protein